MNVNEGRMRLRTTRFVRFDQEFDYLQIAT